MSVRFVLKESGGRDAIGHKQGLISKCKVSAID